MKLSSLTEGFTNPIGVFTVTLNEHWTDDVEPPLNSDGTPMEFKKTHFDGEFWWAEFTPNNKPGVIVRVLDPMWKDKKVVEVPDPNPAPKPDPAKMFPKISDDEGWDF